MSSSVIILGAKGRCGRAAQQAFIDAGWNVSIFGRNWSTPPPEGVTQISGDAFEGDDLIQACKGMDVIVNGLHPPYPQWSKAMPILTANVIKAAQQSGATVIIPGNVYNYGEDMFPILTENTPHRPTCRKGKLRETMERQFKAATNIQTIVLRAGDFIEAEKTGNWFDSQIIKNVEKGSVMYPGPTDVVHAWAYLPDVARAMVGLAEIRETLDQFETFCFEGYSLTGAQLIAAIEKSIGRTLKLTTAPWFAMRLIGLFSPLIREVCEMRYLWNVPHQMEGKKLKKALPDWQETPLEVCMKDVVKV